MPRIQNSLVTKADCPLQCLLPAGQHHNHQQAERTGGALLGPRIFTVRNSIAVQLVIQKANWLIWEAMKTDGTLIRVDLDFKNAFNSAGHSCLWTILEGFRVPDVWLLKNIYENSSMRVQVGGEGMAAIQLDTGTVQGSILSPLLFDLFINALLRLLDSTGISHKVRNATECNHQAFADDLSLYTENTADADTLLRLVQQFQDWSGLKISTKKSLATGPLYGTEACRGRTIANAISSQGEGPHSKKQRADCGMRMGRRLRLR